MTTFQKIIKYLAMAFAIFLTVSIIGGIVSAIAGVGYFFGNNKFATTMDEGELLLDIDPENYTYGVQYQEYIPNQYKMYKLKDVKMTNNNHVFVEPIYTKNKDNPNTYDFMFSQYNLTSLDVSNCYLDYANCGLYYGSNPGGIVVETGHGMFGQYMWKHGAYEYLTDENCSLNTYNCIVKRDDYHPWLFMDMFYKAPSDFDYSWIKTQKWNYNNIPKESINLSGTFAFTDKKEYDLTKTLAQKSINNTNAICNVSIVQSFMGCDDAETITLFDKKSAQNKNNISFVLHTSFPDAIGTFAGCTNLRTIVNLEQYEAASYDHLFEGLSNLRIEPYYIEKFIAPALKAYFNNEDIYIVGKYAFAGCDFSNINYTVDLSEFRKDIKCLDENDANYGKTRYLCTTGFFTGSNIKKFIYDTVPVETNNEEHLCIPHGMFSDTPIEYCDLTGAGTLKLASKDGYSDYISFAGCTKLNTLIVDSVAAPYEDIYEITPDDLDGFRAFRDCTSLKTIIINDRSYNNHYPFMAEGPKQIDALRLFLSKYGLDADNIDIRFKR